MDIGGVTWRKASYSTTNGGGCVEVAQFPASAVGVRDSKNPDDGHLLVPAHEWSAFIQGLKRGEFDL
jgi:hypothetical protein